MVRFSFFDYLYSLFIQTKFTISLLCLDMIHKHAYGRHHFSLTHYPHFTTRILIYIDEHGTQPDRIRQSGFYGIILGYEAQ